MLKANKYRIYPTPQQEELLSKHFGCVRFVYNTALYIRDTTYRTHGKNVSLGKLQAQLTDLKEGFSFFKEVNSQSLQMANRNLETAYDKFFKHLAEFPKYKKKDSKQSFTCPQNVVIDFKDEKKGLIHLPKFKEGIEIVLHRKFKGKVKSVTVSKTPSGKYFASVLTDTKEVIPQKKEIKEETAIGIDLGLTHFAILSDGTKFDNPRHLGKCLKEKKYLQHSRDKKKRGSVRRKKLAKRIARLEEYIANSRKDFLHKLSNEITNRFDTICIETLKIPNMVKNHKLARHISDAGWGMFVEFLKYKAEWKGKNILSIGTFERSSKECNCCGYVKQDLTLADRFWYCPVCRITHDRDINAALVIKKKGLLQCLSLTDWRVERPCQDAEFALSRKGNVEALKIRNNNTLSRAS